MESYCHEYKEYPMSGVPASSSYIPVKNGTELEMNEKERQMHTHYFKPVQQQQQPLDSHVFAGSPAPPINNLNNYPRYGTVIPNRIFVGGIDFKTREEDLQKFFCAFGVVRDTKIIRDRADISKGYGFVTFESAEEANKVREKEDCLYLNGKKLNIGQAIRKQQVCFPKDIHVPPPPGSWILHPGGYASYTNQNGITYFAPASPVVASLQQPQPFTHSHVMAYNGAPYQPVTNHYTSYAYQTQPYNTVHLPWNHTPIPGACGQIIAPSTTHPVEQVNVVPMATPALSAGGYVIPRSAAVVTPQPVASVNAPTRPSDGAIAHQQEKQFIPHQEQPAQPQTIRMIAPQNAATTYVQPATIQTQQLQTAIYANPPPQQIKVQTQHYVGVGEVPQTHYNPIMIQEGQEVPPSMIQGVVKTENDILTPPLTPEQQQQVTHVQSHPSINQQQ